VLELGAQASQDIGELAIASIKCNRVVSGETQGTRSIACLSGIATADQNSRQGISGKLTRALRAG
jgi:hypothetical protein